MKDYVAENERILDEWEQEYKKNGLNTENYFARDGIMYRGDLSWDGKNWRHNANGHENSLWLNAPLRILYLTKDQNVGDEYCWDVRGESYHTQSYPNDENKLWRKYRFIKMLVRTLYGLSIAKQSFQKYENIDDTVALHVADTISYARINCKKEGGTRQCSDSILIAAVNQYADFLKRQIVNLDADVFVCCMSKEMWDNNTKECFYYNYILCEVLNELCNYHFEKVQDLEVYYDAIANKVAINSYHLSYIIDESQSYNDIVEQYHKFLQTNEGKQFIEKLH